MPIVRFEGEQLALLMSIREGKRTFDEIMALAQDVLADCDSMKATANLPDRCDLAQAEKLLWTITEHWERRIG